MSDIHPAVAAAPYGRVEQISPRVRRLLAKNPSPFTYTGTGTYIIGQGEVAVIDPGPRDDAHVAALIEALRHERVSDIVITHTHLDHSPAAAPLKAATGARIVGCAPLAIDDDGPRADAAFDRAYAPDLVLADGDQLRGPDWTLTALHTPGHTSNHLCFTLEEEAALFTGDHVMGWSTTVVSPPDGDMADYMASLKRLIDRADRVYYPTHGDAITEPQRLVRGLLAHRRQRESQIVKLLGEGEKSIPEMVRVMYALINTSLHGAAGRSVLAHLIDMETRGLVARSDAERWRLA